ncbi:NACHT, LRR and PYD domains-containing protein 3-like isoform X1 [Crotalus tigris]|uniref:NACHT, LRR and PYD domains-containing protein 3-like isoform X1 n=1 Tax=Crotalus tigris TaxID=88082 RepID=UPI00192F4377|nr:NACHT, LRR and PYD domains-containing protein 3-like isoform X1 [Crotalus tigris]XP_039189963.1 NACHT, LRR and PYD domains-containing protein 3-like isoform X1 [Crotalus tigris]XP_039189964.1 NACHT, LRR and PYD domains-containing protein 3-like isoform X1 [Crotalus tigris]XP_039189965.1 NACHT, LRR and PYD domains-containing protein 3-like isoform X1 [Crotalus tigris]
MATGGGKMKDLLVDALERLEEKDIKLFKSKLRCVAAPWGKNIPRGRLENADRLDLVELLVEFYEEKAATLMIAILEDMGFKKNASNLSKELKDQVQGYKKKYAKYVKEECKNIERNSLCGESIPLNSRYAKLLIIQKHQSQKQKEHELLATGGLHLEILRTYSHNLSIDLEDLFEPDESGTIPKTVVLQGPAGIGKSMTVQKMMLDWADGRLYPDMFDYVFCIHCQELNFAEKASSLVELINEQCQDRVAPVDEILAHSEKLLFIVDGFDELSHFLESEGYLCDNPNLKVPLESILSSLLRKILLPDSFLLITTRPGALERLQQCLKFPWFTEIVGFSEKGRREFFSKFFEEEKKANIALRFIENTVAVSTICFIPMVCWIICSVMKIELETEDEIAGTLDTTTKVFLQFSHIFLKHDNPRWKTSPENEFRKLCSLARAGIMQQKVLFEEQDLKEHCLDISALKDLFLEKRAFGTGLGRCNLYSFFHLCFQEFFAAMWYILPAESTEEMDHIMDDLQRLLVEWEKPNNQHFALTICFIFGLTNEKTHIFFEQALQCKTSDLVKPLLLQKAEEVAAKEHIQKRYFPLNFFHCLFESQEPEFAKRVMHHFQNINFSSKTLSMLDCKVLAFCLQHSTIEDHSLCLHFCGLKSHHIKALGPGIKNCTTLEFGDNKFGNSGVNVLCTILKQLGCNLADLKLDCNNLTDACAQELCTVLRTSHRLFSLGLQDNSFTENSVPFIQDLMKKCTSLAIVDLSSNNFNKRGQKSLNLQVKEITESGRRFVLWI